MVAGGRCGVGGRGQDHGVELSWGHREGRGHVSEKPDSGEYLLSLLSQ